MLNHLLCPEGHKTDSSWHKGHMRHSGGVRETQVRLFALYVPNLESQKENPDKLKTDPEGLSPTFNFAFYSETWAEGLIWLIEMTNKTVTVHCPFQQLKLEFGKEQVRKSTPDFDKCPEMYDFDKSMNFHNPDLERTRYDLILKDFNQIWSHLPNY